MTLVHDGDRAHPHDHVDDHEHEGHVHHDHAHAHDHVDDHEHEGHAHHGHSHAHPRGILGSLAAVLHLDGHSHSHEDLAGDGDAGNNGKGMRVIIIGSVLLGITALLQVLVFAASGSVALLGDTVHNFSDALGSIPLLIAFWLSGRAATKRYTYGYGRAEDLAGLVIVLSIGLSAVYLLWESVNRLLSPQPPGHLAWLAAAALIGFAGNELVASLQIRTGREIGSEAMVANGYHARTDGLTSLAVLAAAVGVWLGFPILDPVIGVIMGLVILWITLRAARSMWYRLMDAADPKTVAKVESVIREHGLVMGLNRLQMRWHGHSMRVEAVVTVDGCPDAAQCRAIADHLSHHLYHEIPNLGETTLEVLPCRTDGGQAEGEVSHHRKRGAEA